MIGGEMLIFFRRDCDLSYRPKIGLAAARILVLAWRVAWIPALAIEIVCCSMASWMATWSLSSILSNSSIQQIPLSASNNAPASIETLPLSGSVTTLAVSPAAVVVLPLVYTLLGTNLLIHFRNCDFAVEGSPTIKMLISPRNEILVPVFLWIPPNNWSSNAFLISICPNISWKSDSASYS